MSGVGQGGRSGLLGRISRVPAAGLIAAMLWTCPAQAQRADDDVVSAAGDAFGMSVGNETVGVYNTEMVRGFSPVVAGNIRIEGLYFDLAGELNNRLIDGSTIRIGLTAQSYPLPAPTGIVDYRLRIAGSKRVLGTVFGLADFYGPYGELDLQLPIAGERLGLAAGLSHKNEEYADGSDARILSRAAVLTGRPNDALRLTPFWSRLDGRDAEAQPVITLAVPQLPPALPKRTFFGQQWAANDYHVVNAGLLGSLKLGSGWVVRAGLFRSSRSDDSEFTDSFRNMQADGTARHVIIADPAKGTISWSGEFRVTRLISDGPRRHALRAILRGRDRRARYGGSAVLDFGTARVDEAVELAEPATTFGEQTRDRVRQRTGGLAYEGVWKDVGTLSMGIQKTDYRKTVKQPRQPVAASGDAPWLFYANAAVQLTDRLDMFAGHTRGLEETGIAPENASNRGDALPAARTRQTEAGLRYALTPDLKLVAAAFDVRKPYFNLDLGNLFTRLGQVRHQGIEMSLAGSILPRLKVIAGAVLLRARVTGEAVELGRVGPRPINTSPQRVRAILDYSPPIIDGLSVELGLEHDGKRVASRDNRLSLPVRTLVRGGARYRFRLGRTPAQLRLLMENIADSFAWKVSNSGGLRINAGRRLTGYLAVDL